VDEKRWADALHAYDELLTRSQSGSLPYEAAAKVYVQRGIAQLHLGRYEEAVGSFAAAGALRPTALEPDILKAVAYRSQGDGVKAEEVFEAIYKRTRSPDVPLWAAMFYFARFNDSERVLWWADRLEPGFWRDFWRTISLTALQRTDEAVEPARRLPEHEPDIALSHAIAAVTLTAHGEAAEGERLARRAVELAPRSAMVQLVLAQALHFRGQGREAFERIERAVELEPKSAAPRYIRGMVFPSLEQAAAAERDLRAAVELMRESGSGFIEAHAVHWGLAQALSALGREDESLAPLEEAMQLARQADRLPPGLVLELATRRFSVGRKAAALRCLEEALDHASTSLTAATSLELRLRDLAERAQPDLPTYRSIDLALTALDRHEIVERGAVWKYFKGTGPPSVGLEWTQLDFDDSGWESGASGFGYGDDDDATVLSDMRNGYTSVYIRRECSLPDIAKLEAITLEVWADDGFIAYLNGVEVFRFGVGTDGTLAHDAVASANASEPIRPVRVPLAPELFARTGANIVCLQGLNVSAESSDFSLLPVLVTTRPSSREDVDELSGRFEAVAGGGDVVGRRAYLRGRRLQREGKYAEAVEHFDVARFRSPSRWEPVVAYAECLRATRRTAGASSELARLLEDSCPGNPRVWDLWLEIQLLDLRRGPEGILAARPCARGRYPAASCAENVRWLLETLAAGGALRINSAGGRFTGRDGKVWAADRFCTAGVGHEPDRHPFAGEIALTDDDPIYRTDRYFPAASDRRTGYRIPLPLGSYRVTLHFAETYRREPPARAFDVYLEDTRVLTGHEPITAGFATAHSRSFDVEVQDGALEIAFGKRVGDPHVAALEIEPR